MSAAHFSSQTFRMSVMHIGRVQYMNSSPYRHIPRADYVSGQMQFSQKVHVFSVCYGYEPSPLPIPTCHRHHAYPVSTRYRLAVSRMRTRHIPHADIVHTSFRSDACSFVRRCLRWPAYVSYRRFASYSTAGEWLRPFEPRKGKRREKR